MLLWQFNGNETFCCSCSWEFLPYIWVSEIKPQLWQLDTFSIYFQIISVKIQKDKRFKKFPENNI